MNFLFFLLKIKINNSGTGHSCIYPLLACRLNPTWKFIATGIFFSKKNKILMKKFDFHILIDIDPNSIEYSKKNVEMNNFQDRIQCIQNFDSNYLVLPFVQQDSRFFFYGYNSYFIYIYRLDLIFVCVIHHFMKIGVMLKQVENLRKKNLLL